MSLELLSIAYGVPRVVLRRVPHSLHVQCFREGISTFAEALAGREVVIFSDNTGAESVTRKGSLIRLRCIGACRALLPTCSRA